MIQTISVDFKRVTDQWKKNDKISIHKGNISWVLAIRKRPSENRTTINDGWIKF